MSESKDIFRRYRREHARLHDPAVLQSSVELIPVDANSIARSSKTRERHEKRDAGGGSPTRMPVPGSQRSGSSSEGRSQDDPLMRGALMDYFRTAPNSAGGRPAEKSTKESLPTERAEELETGLNLVAEPSSIECRLDMFQDQPFEIVAPGAQKVELVWQPLAGSEAQRVLMDRQNRRLFSATIGIDDGDYLFGYEVDGCMRPEPRDAQKLVIRNKGVFTRLRLSRHNKSFTLHNYGTADGIVRIEADAAWLRTDRELKIPAHGAVEPTIQIILPEVAPGGNQGILQVDAHSETGEAVAGPAITVAANVDVGGAIPEFQYRPSEFGWIMQGTEQVQLEVEVRARGRGRLMGMVNLAHSGEMTNFQLNADDQSRFFHTFTINSFHLPYRAEGALKVTLLTDSYLANYRLFKAEVPYRLIYLKKSLPALTFGKIRQGFMKTLRLEVARSDGKDMELSVAAPPSTASYLECYPVRSNVYVFRMNTQRLQPGTMIDEMITLTDRYSQLKDKIKVLAEVVNFRASDLVGAGISS